MPAIPLLFALAIEPLAIEIRANQRITVFCYSNMQEKAMLYMDVTLLMLGDTDLSLREAMSTITKLGGFSSSHMNWSKSALLLLDRDDTVCDFLMSYTHYHLLKILTDSGHI